MASVQGQLMSVLQLHLPGGCVLHVCLQPNVTVHDMGKSRNNKLKISRDRSGQLSVSQVQLQLEGKQVTLEQVPLKHLVAFAHREQLAEGSVLTEQWLLETTQGTVEVQCVDGNPANLQPSNLCVVKHGLLDSPQPQLPPVCFAPQPEDEARARSICGKPAVAGQHTCAAHQRFSQLAEAAQRVVQQRIWLRWLQLRWLRAYNSQSAKQRGAGEAGCLSPATAAAAAAATADAALPQGYAIPGTVWQEASTSAVAASDDEAGCLSPAAAASAAASAAVTVGVAAAALPQGSAIPGTVWQEASTSAVAASDDEVGCLSPAASAVTVGVAAAALPHGSSKPGTLWQEASTSAVAASDDEAGCLSPPAAATAAATAAAAAAAAAAWTAGDAAVAAALPQGSVVPDTVWQEVPTPAALEAAVASAAATACYDWDPRGYCRDLMLGEPEEFTPLEKLVFAQKQCQCSHCIATAMAASAASLAATAGEGTQEHDVGACSDPSNCCACLAAKVQSVARELCLSRDPLGLAECDGCQALRFDWAHSCWEEVFFPASTRYYLSNMWAQRCITSPCDGSQRTDSHKGKCLAMLKTGLCINKVWVGDVITLERDFNGLERHYCLKHLLSGEHCFGHCFAKHHVGNYNRDKGAHVVFAGGLGCLLCDAKGTQQCDCLHNRCGPQGTALEYGEDQYAWLQADYLIGTDSIRFIHAMEALYPSAVL